jgi:hypothetical protein
MTVKKITLCLQNGKTINYYGDSAESCHAMRMSVKFHIQKLSARYPLAGYYLSKGYIMSAAKVMGMVS